MTDRFTIHHGDCLRFMADMPEASVDAVITDPPYSSGGMFRGDRSKTSTADKYTVDSGQAAKPDFHGDTRDQRGFAFWCALWFSEAYRVAREGAVLAVFTDWRQLPTITDVIQAGGWCYRGIVPWNKTEATRPMKGWFRSQCEYVVVAAKGKPARLDQTGTGDAPCLPGFLVCPVDRDNEHQTQKPVDLMRWICRAVRPAGVVLDPFAGSGSTGVAALLEGLEFIGCEMSEEYVAIARRRCQETVDQGVAQSIPGVLVAPEGIQQGIEGVA